MKKLVEIQTKEIEIKFREYQVDDKVVYDLLESDSNIDSSIVTSVS